MALTIVGEAGTSPERFGPSKYHLVEHAHGFSLEGPDRPLVQVSCGPTFLEVDVPRFPGGPPQRFGFYELYRFNTAVAVGLMREWQPPRREGAVWPHVRQWAVMQTEKAINHRVLHQWQSPAAYRRPDGPGREDTMISTAEAKDLVNDLFEEEALVIGGLVAVHDEDTMISTRRHHSPSPRKARH